MTQFSYLLLILFPSLSKRKPKELPEDLVIQILLWLPVVSLLRLKCVCKSWYALITHQNFITKHLLHNKNNTLFLLKMRDKTTRDFIVSTLSYETLQVSRTQPIPPLYFEIAKEVNIFVVGSCNGLVCLHDYRELHDVIWNPATKETKLVPKSNLPHVAPAGYHTFFEGMGFGFDAKTNDYKIINILSISHPYDYLILFDERVIPQKEVYSLSADSWRKVDGPSCFLCNGFKGPGTYINGMASWLAYVGHWESFVLTFDMSDEVFQKTPLPDNVTGNMLFPLNESIAMSFESVVDEECFALCFDIWLLLKVGSKDSWTRLFTIGPFTELNQSIGLPYPLGFWTNDTMFVENYDGQLVLYDPSTKQMTNLQIWNGNRNSLQLVSYMETLVSVKGGNEFEEQEA